MNRNITFIKLNSKGNILNLFRRSDVESILKKQDIMTISKVIKILATIFISQPLNVAAEK